MEPQQHPTDSEAAFSRAAGPNARPASSMPSVAPASGLYAAPHFSISGGPDGCVVLVEALALRVDGGNAEGARNRGARLRAADDRPGDRQVDAEVAAGAQVEVDGLGPAFLEPGARDREAGTSLSERGILWAASCRRTVPRTASVALNSTSFMRPSRVIRPGGRPYRPVPAGGMPTASRQVRIGGQDAVSICGIAESRSRAFQERTRSSPGPQSTLTPSPSPAKSRLMKSSPGPPLTLPTPANSSESLPGPPSSVAAPASAGLTKWRPSFPGPPLIVVGTGHPELALQPGHFRDVHDGVVGAGAEVERDPLHVATREVRARARPGITGHRLAAGTRGRAGALPDAVRGPEQVAEVEGPREAKDRLSVTKRPAETSLALDHEQRRLARGSTVDPQRPAVDADRRGTRGRRRRGQRQRHESQPSPHP